MLFIIFPFLLCLILYIGFSVSLLIYLCFILLIFKRDFFVSFQSLKSSRSCQGGLFLHFPFFTATETVHTCLLYIGLLKEHPASSSLWYVSSEIFPGVLKSPSCGSSNFMLLCLGLLLLEEPSIPGFLGHFHQAALTPSNPFLPFN